MIRILLMLAGLVAILPPYWSVQGSNLPINFDSLIHMPQLSTFTQPLLKRESKRSHSADEVAAEAVEAEAGPKAAEEAAESAAEVVWTSECSPRVAGVRRGQDARLECQMIAPSGSVLTWFKDDQLLHRKGARAEVMSTATEEELLEEMTNRVVLAETPSSLVQISSAVYLDCVKDEHQATYKLVVRLPYSYKQYTRQFTVVIVGEAGVASEEGPSCRLGPLVNALPRIYQHSPAAMGHVGDSVTLPCRSQGLNVTQAWFLDGHRISEHSAGHKLLSNGDLMVELRREGRARYLCKATSTRYAALRDAAVTVVATI